MKNPSDQTNEEWLEDYKANLHKFYQKAGRQEKNMPLIAKNVGGGDYQIAPEGNHTAICYMIVDLGYQETGFGVKPKVLIGWELCNELMSDGRPFVVSQRYTLSLNEKANLRRDLESWRGRAFTDEELDGFDLKKVLNAPCLLQVVHNDHNGRTYANVKAVTAVPKEIQVPARQNDTIWYSLEEDEGYDQLHDWIKNVIEKRVDYESIVEIPTVDKDYGDSF